MEAGVSDSSSKGRYVSSTPFRTATYCLSELSILHQSRYSLLQEGEKTDEYICKRETHMGWRGEEEEGERKWYRRRQ